MSKENTFRSLGASSHAIEDREENDYYATEPKALELLLDLEEFNKNIWEPACGEPIKPLRRYKKKQSLYRQSNKIIFRVVKGLFRVK